MKNQTLIYSSFDYFDIGLTREQVTACSHSGSCDDDVETVLQTEEMKNQLSKISDENLIKVLRDLGAWDQDEFQDRKANEMRIVWIAAGDIAEGK